MPCPLSRRTRTGARVGCFPVCTAFPETQAGRRPRLHFRGLLRLHSRYGLSDCSIARGDLCHEASARWVAPPNRSSATSATDNSLGGTFLHWQTAPSGRTEFFGIVGLLVVASGQALPHLLLTGMIVCDREAHELLKTHRILGVEV